MNYDEAFKAAKARFDSIAKPLDGLGYFEDIICRIAAIQQKEIPDISNKALVIMIADNGVTAEKVTQTSSSVTAAVAGLMAEGKSTVGMMLREQMVDIIPVDIGIDSDQKIDGLLDMKVKKSTGNIVKEPAMTDDECIKAICAGMKIAKDLALKKTGIIATGEMGIGNTTTSTALFCALTGFKTEDIVGRGAGLTDEGLLRKTDAIHRAIKYHKYDNTCYITPSKDNAFEMLAKLGGLDIAGLVGVYTGAAMCHIPVVIDGFISAVAALAAQYICPGVVNNMIASHAGKEKGTAKALELLGLRPVIDADMALGEGTGAVLLFPMLDMVLSLYRQGVSFDDAGVSSYKRFEEC